MQKESNGCFTSNSGFFRSFHPVRGQLQLAMRICSLLAVIVLVSSAFPLSAAESPSQAVYVNNLTGDAKFDGSAEKPAGDGKSGPCATIMQALKAAAVGGRVIISNTGKDYRERVRVQGFRKGRAATPLVIEGSGAAVSGLVTVPAALWTPHQNDVYFYEYKGKDNPLNESENGLPNSNWLGHWKHQGWFTEKQAPEIFFVNGKPATHTRDLESIPAGGFFYDTQAQPRRLYFRLPADAKIEECTVDIPLNAGVFVDDDYVVIRNLISRYSQDDGFAGFWGVGVVFENCSGSFNCDQGISLHGTSMTLIDGGLFERNGGCGIADVMSSFTLYRNVVVRDNMITGALFQGLAHSMLSCRIYGNYGTQISSGTGSVLNLTNCLIIGVPKDEGGDAGIQMERGRIDHCTIVNCTTGLAVGKSADVRNSVFTNCSVALVSVPAAALPEFRLNTCWLTGGKVSLGNKMGDAATWTEFVKTTSGIDKISWEDLKLEAPLFTVPDNSPSVKSADYGTCPGAVLKPWEGWQALLENSAPEVHPHP